MRNADGTSHDGRTLAKNLLKTLGREPLDGEKIVDHQERVIKDGLNIIDIRLQ
jgi:hypothetical protein